MHLALPSRKTSDPPPYAPSRFPRIPTIRRRRLQTIAIGAAILVGVIYIFSKIFGGGDGIPSGTAPVVIVTVLDPEQYPKEYIENVRENRIEYARKHGKSFCYCTYGGATCSIITHCRLRNTLSNHRGLRSRRLAIVMGEGASSSTCDDQIPVQYLCVVP